MKKYGKINKYKKHIFWLIIGLLLLGVLTYFFLFNEPEEDVSIEIRYFKDGKEIKNTKFFQQSLTKTL